MASKKKSKTATVKDQPVVKTGKETPVASVWRPTLSKIVEAFVEKDYALKRGIDDVDRISAADAKQIKAYIADYGETLVPLPEETWESSVSQWTSAGRWEVLVDLHTEESGPSDMVVEVHILEKKDGGFRYQVHLVYVP